MNTSQPMHMALSAMMTKTADSGAKGLKNARAIFRGHLKLIGASEIPDKHDQMRVAINRCGVTLDLNPKKDSDILAALKHVEAEREARQPKTLAAD